MRTLRRGFVAVLLALVLSAPAAAQIAPTYYWSCNWYLFGIGPWAWDIVETSTPEAPGTYDFSGTGWLCDYLGACYYTQDINGNVESYCD